MKTPKNKGKWTASTEMLCQSSRGQPTPAKQRAPGQGEALPSEGITLPGRPTRCRQLPASTHRPCASSCPWMPRCTSVHARRPVASPCAADYDGATMRTAHRHHSSQARSNHHDTTPCMGSSKLRRVPASESPQEALPAAVRGSGSHGASVGLRYRIRAVFIHLTGSPSIHIDASKRVVHSSSRPAKPVVLPHPHMSPRKTSPFVANR